MAKETGFELEYLEKLVFHDESFFYKGKEYAYEKIQHIVYSATATKHSVNGLPTGTSYETTLQLELSDNHFLSIEQEFSFLRGSAQKGRSEAVMRAASILHEVTFAQRIEHYEKQLEEKGFVSWNGFQFHKNGDLFKKNLFLFNLKDKDVERSLLPFNFEVGKKPVSLKEKIIKAWSGNHNINIMRDKDCFLYFMKHYLGFSWEDTPVKTKRRTTRKEFDEALLVLGAKLCKADGCVTKDEIQVFKTYFDIDEKSHPGSSKIFKDAVSSNANAAHTAKTVYTLFEGKTEPLEYILLGLIHISAADGIISKSERALIEEIAKEFHFTVTEINRLFLIYDKPEPSTKSVGIHLQYLRILGLNEGATEQEIKAAYKQMARKHHPDLLRAQGVPVDSIKDSEEILKAVTAAYQWLNNYYTAERKQTA